MKRSVIWLVLALTAAGFGSAQAQTSEYPLQSGVLRAEARAKAAAPACEKELRGGKSGPACGRYHSAAIAAMALQSRRQTWCNEKMSGERVAEASSFKIAASCLAGLGQNMDIDKVEGLERKADRPAARKFDHDMSQFSPY